MAGQTYKWLGGNGTGGNINDASVAANWLIENSGTFAPASTTPATGDTVLLASGTADITNGTSDITGVTFDFTGASATLNLANATIDDTSSFTALAGSTGTIGIGANVVSSATLFAIGAGASIDVALSAALTNNSVMVAQTGGAIGVTAAVAGSTLTNDGGVVAYTGNADIATGVSGFGLLVTASGTLALHGAVAGSQSVIFGDANATLTLSDSGHFNARLLAFETGDTIDLRDIQFAHATLSLNSNVLTVSDGTTTATLSFNGANLSGASQFSLAPDSGTGSKLTVNSVVNPIWLGSPALGGGGVWSTGSLWSTGHAPTAADTAQFTSLGGTPFTVTASGTQAVNTLVFLSPGNTLNVTGTLAATRAIFEAVGLIAESAGASITAKTFTQLTGGGVLTMATGASMALSGGSPAGNNGNSGAEIEGGATLTGGHLTANASSIRIGWFGAGTVDVTAGSVVQANFTDIGASGTASGTLTIDASTWTDTATDLSAPFAGQMVVGGGNIGNAGAIPGGSGTLIIQNGATLNDGAGAVIAQNTASSGTVMLSTGAHWNVTGNLLAGAAGSSNATLFINNGTTGGAGGHLAVSGSIVANGSLSVTSASTATAGALVIGSGSLNVDGSSLLRVGTGTSGPANGWVIEPGATASIGGGASESTSLDILGTLVTSGATLNGAIGGSGVIEIASHTTLTVNALTPAPWSAQVVFAPGGGGDFKVPGPADNSTGKISGLGPVANTIDLPGITYSSFMPLTYEPTSGVLTLGLSGSFLVGQHFTLDPGLNLTYAMEPDPAGGTQIVLSTPCYAAGTAIATPGGGCAVEALRPGDAVLVQDGEQWVARPVRWVGRFTVDLARHPAPEQAAPIRICADAVAPGVPCRDLLVSPDHALLMDGVLMQAQALVNGATIRREQHGQCVTYVHVELDRHGILCAEGLAAESYLDTGNRGEFDAEAGVRPLFPDLAGQRRWASDACAPLVLDGPAVDAAHARLLARAENLGHRRTNDDALRVLADGVAVPLILFGTDHVQALLPPGVTDVRLLSRSFVPNAFNRRAGDGRRLGLAVRAVRLDGQAVPPAWLGQGWHPAEPDWRWTDGAAALALAPAAHTRVLELEMAPAAPGYWLTLAA